MPTTKLVFKDTPLCADTTRWYKYTFWEICLDLKNHIFSRY